MIINWDTYRERDKGKTKTEKLILDQNNKTENMVHYRMLKFYVKMGVKVKKYIEKLNLSKIIYVEIIYKTIQIKEQQLKLKQRRM